MNKNKIFRLSITLSPFLERRWRCLPEIRGTLFTLIEDRVKLTEKGICYCPSEEIENCETKNLWPDLQRCRESNNHFTAFTARAGRVEASDEIIIWDIKRFR